MKTRWQNKITSVLGLWVFASPWVFNYSREDYAWNFYIFGLAITALSVVALNDRRIWENWVILFISVWLYISTWVLGFSAETGAFWNMLATSIITGTMSYWAMSVQGEPAAA